MRSLRSQLVLLVVVVVLATLSMLALYGTRSARTAFRAHVERSFELGTAEPDLAGLEAAFADGGWAAVGGRVEADSARPMIVVDRDDRVRAATDTAWRNATGRRRADGALLLEKRTARGATVIGLMGGLALRGNTGDTVGHLFAMPLANISVDSVERAFASGFDRRLWIGVPLLLLLASAGAFLLSGRMLAPIGRFTEAVQSIARGDYQARVGNVPGTEFRPLATAIDRMAETLERSEATRRRLIRDVAHELRTPLTNLRGQVEALQDKLREPTPEMLTSLHDETRLLERLVDDLGELARAEAGDLRIDPANLDLAAQATKAADAFVQSRRIGPHRIVIDIPARLTVWADAARVAQILRNLIENAIVHGQGTDPITIAASATDPETVEISVRDGGKGIAAEHLPHVFERLYRSDPSRARGSGGAGLGLPIVKALVEAHGGSVAMESVVNGGTVVRFSLPRPDRT